MIEVENTHRNKNLFSIMLGVFILSILIFIVKIAAFVITKSDSIFSDAIESIANILASGFGLFGVYYSKRPKDITHPYGHGKIEYLAAGFEGALILFAAITILFKATYSLVYVKQIEAIDIGIWIIAATSVLNFSIGIFLIRIGQKSGSTILHADGKHLISDGITSIGIIVGLILVLTTGYKFIDSIIAILLGLFTFYTGFKLVKAATENLMDKADLTKLNSLALSLQNIRKNEWIDIHNLRILNYGNAAHIDCHLTLPYFFTVVQSQEEVKLIERELKLIWKNELELFIHVDACVPGKMCESCGIKNCEMRKMKFNKPVEWNIAKLLDENS